MDYIKINKLIKVSIYKQIAQSISEAIENGCLKYNDRLPTEKELCELFNISQTTVKRAYDMLINAGKIKRIKGKGTFITNRKTFFTELRKFYEFDLKKINESEEFNKEIILKERIFSDFGAYRALKLKEGEVCYTIIQVLKVKNNPLLFQKIFLPKKYYPDLEKNIHKNFTLFDFIEKRYKYQIKNLHSTFSTINASSAESLVLQISPDEAIYFIRTIISDINANKVAYVCNYFPGEFTEFEVTVNAI